MLIKKIMPSSAERQKKFRERKSHGGLFKRRDFWVHPDDEPHLRKIEIELRNKRLDLSCVKIHTKD